MRFSIRNLMLLVLIVALGFTMYRTLTRPLVVVGVVLLLEVLAWWSIVWHHPRWSIWGFWIGSIVTNGLIGLTCIYFVSIGGLAIMGLVTLVVLPMTLGCGMAWAWRMSRAEGSRRRSIWLAWTLVIVMGLSPVTMMMTFWPLHLAFRLSRPALNAMADRVAAGRPVTGSEWAGFYEIVRSKYDAQTGEVALIIDDDPAGRSGFLRLAPGDPVGRSGLFTNLNFNEHLDERWRYRNED